MTTYEQQAAEFLTVTGTTFTAEFLENGKHCEDDANNRDIYKITLKKGQRKYSFKFGQSLVNSTKYVDNVTKNEYTTNGSPLKGNMRVVTLTYFSEYCRKVPGTAPTAYDVLACLTKYDPGTFEDFCGEFGYDTDSRKAYKTYKAVKREWKNVAILFTDEQLDMLREIN